MRRINRLFGGGSEPPEVDESQCLGTTIAFNRRDRFAREPHDRRFRDHAGNVVPGLARSWGNCWKCNRSLGCTICTTTNELEILCRPCAAWGTVEAFLHHGPIMEGGRIKHVATFAEYPESWRKRYEPPEAVGTKNVAAMVKNASKVIAFPVKDVRFESDEEWR